MRVLLINQFFPPDAAATGVLLGDVAEELFASGCDVRVICGAARYAGDFSHECTRMDTDRVRTLSFSHGKLAKVLSYLSFYSGALIGALTGPRPDVVVTLTTPPGLAWIGWVLQRLRRSRHVVWEMDVYPDIAVDLGVRIGWLGGLLDFPRWRADRVIALGACMKERLVARGVAVEKISVCENWAKDDLATDERRCTRMDVKHVRVGRGGQTDLSTAVASLPSGQIGLSPIAQDPVRVIYSGNLGLAHDVGTICDVMRRFDGDGRFEFVFAGGGARRASLEDRCREFRNVRFEDWTESLGERLASCHLGLVTQKSETVGSVVPSKTYGLMAAGRAVLFIGPGAATPARVIREFGCGWHFECGDVAGVTGLLEELADRPQVAAEAGARGRRAWEEFYCREVGAARVVDVILAAKGGG